MVGLANSCLAAGVLMAAVGAGAVAAGAPAGAVVAVGCEVCWLQAATRPASSKKDRRFMGVEGGGERFYSKNTP